MLRLHCLTCHYIQASLAQINLILDTEQFFLTCFAFTSTTLTADTTDGVTLWRRRRTGGRLLKSFALVRAADGHWQTRDPVEWRESDTWTRRVWSQESLRQGLVGLTEVQITRRSRRLTAFCSGATWTRTKLRTRAWSLYSMTLGSLKAKVD